MKRIVCRRRLWLCRQTFHIKGARNECEGFRSKTKEKSGCWFININGEENDVTRKIIKSKCFHLSSSWKQKCVYDERKKREKKSWTAKSSLFLPVEKSFAWLELLKKSSSEMFEKSFRKVERGEKHAFCILIKIWSE